MLTLNLKSDCKHPKFNTESVRSELIDLFNRAGITEGEFSVRLYQRSVMRRENSVLRIDQSSSVSCLFFSTWLTDMSGARHFIECELYSLSSRKHGLKERMQTFAKKLNNEPGEALLHLRKRLAADIKILKRTIVRIRETRKKIRNMEAQ